MSTEITGREAEGIKWDFVAIGSGTAGADAAIRAAQLGLKVLLIERDRSRLGGTCVNVGCVPTKKLLYLADHYHELGRFLINEGLIASTKLDVKAMFEAKDRLISQVISWYTFKVLPSYGVRQLIGEARLVSPRSIKVGDSIIEARNVLIATGSRPKIPPIKGMEQGLRSGFAVTSDDFFYLRSIPDSVLIIGGGAIGIELGTLLSKLGSRVTIVEVMDRLLPTFPDPELGNYLASRIMMEMYGVNVKVGTSVTEVDPSNKMVRLSSGETVKVDAVLIATGREPNTQGLNLEGVGVEVRNGAVMVDDHSRTNIPGIYAAGDVTGKYMLASVAKVQGIAAAENAAGLDSRVDYSLVPMVVFSDPEIASVGISVGKDDPRYVIAKMPNYINYRAIAYNKPYGWTKIVVDRAGGKIVGFHMIGPWASEIVNMATIAIKKGLTLDEAKELVFSHPVFSELLIDTMELVSGGNVYLPKR
ncbi:dihydrolipoyl dehydrogenase family protein [Vulcanisaeta souniana]|uniref:Dihydrolipoyl dehydrogenase n=1 Tax=Vulcanisaeta souniana JCM 11219 TaxID=1293586 RepID=A0A830EJA6_9CREN|nr:NAD(P)/FAD-dependent oxidoreductase [Vulcanisaeta souniana]BDR93412.1 dihydrolipoyl dehydrogenase [Vulcanisaeta souniana JCM 11219]GGI76928.1 dihydrolipoyl dehydrogenase [Vulcanisaeta souniana JCM 11219]